MVRLEPMDPDRFEAYIRALIRSYADDNVRAGRWTADEAIAESRKQVEGLLPQGAATPNHYLLSIMAEPGEDPVGTIWLAIEPRGGFIYDLEVFEPYRRRGFAEQAMRQLEEFSRARGARRLLLHVFGDNRGARQLYDKLGYQETNVMMAKALVP